MKHKRAKVDDVVLIHEPGEGQHYFLFGSLAICTAINAGLYDSFWGEGEEDSVLFQTLSPSCYIILGNLND